MPAGKYVQVSSGNQTACAVRSDGYARCWGQYASTYPPPATSTFTQVSWGISHGCGVLASTGAVACWGVNTYGQATPPAGTFTKVAAGDQDTCGLRPTAASNAGVGTSSAS